MTKILIEIDPETHVLVPKGMMYELPELPMPIKGKFSKDLFDGFQMHQYAMRYLDEAIAAAPQPEPVDVDPMGYVGYGDRVEWYKKPAPETDLYTTPQPDRTAELEAALKVAKAALEYYVPMIKQGDSPAEEAIAKIEGVLKWLKSNDIK